jgi:hypothetical protein
VRTKVARRFIFLQKIPNWVYFGGPWNGKYWYIYLQYFNADWRISWPFGIVCGHLAHTFFTFWFA